MDELERITESHVEVTRRHFLGLGAATGIVLSKQWTDQVDRYPELADAVAKLEYLTKDEEFHTLGRGNPPPHTLPAEKLREVGLTRDTWFLEVQSDPDSNSQIDRPLTRSAGTALGWKDIMGIAEKRAVRFMHVMSCTNGRAPFGMGLWEGVPLRDIVWMAQPVVNVRRIFYYGYHNNDPQQIFRSSSPIGRVLEDPPGELPIILAYKLNGRWLSPARGGPVRMIVPGQYGNRSVKWIQHILLTNNYQSNDTYALRNNDTVSRVKTCARFIDVPEHVGAGRPIPVTGLAQVGMSGLKAVQYWLNPQDKPLPADDPYFTKAPWKNAQILPPPDRWGGGLPDGRLPDIPSQFDPATGQPRRWPLTDTIVHWAALLTDVSSGKYELRCRTIDANGIAQPMPRPFAKSGKNFIQRVKIVVEA